MKFTRHILSLFVLLTALSCNNVLDKQPLDKLQGENLFSNPEGVKLYMANLYYQLPIEDFTFFRQGFNWNTGDPNNGGFAPAMITDEAVHTEFGDFIGDGDFQWWDQGYKLIRDTNILIDIIPTLDINEDETKALVGESSFIRAYAYFALVKRYGGVPLITAVQKYEGDVEALKVPRSTEKESWEFVMKECDVAIANLADSWPGGERRATKWVAYALKSRAALHAASLAKYGERAPISGTAVDQKLVGMDKSAAAEFYKAAIEASEAIINSGKFALYKPTPASPAEAAENYRKLFEDPNIAPGEAIFIKGFARPGSGTGHNYGIWFQPNQTANGWPHPGRMNPTLDLIDAYESYTNPGQSAPITTTVAGNDVSDYNGFDPAKNYKRYEDPAGIYKDKDARLWATAILPGTAWKGQKIIIQAGFIKPDGNAQLFGGEPIKVGSTTIYPFGAADRTQYSGFDTWGGNNTRTGVSFKKFLNEGVNVAPGWNQTVSDWADFRYAEILLNYAEAIVESGTGAAAKGAQALNDIRRRAGHTKDIPLTIDNVIRERRVELAFENKRFWDLVRRREYHTLFNNRVRHALIPVLDLRVTPAKYIFIRENIARLNPATFDYKQYYRSIPGIGANGLVQNPQY
ncbi:RagB/SusD family nutrient uptake outer membrane protein [Dyadobacter sp. CY326]|uniref:RagB/SusD family nutrient uptake outer membrane protein n=1 Tax=Dyadobacter sp. CY326 TaxID=2907300 RepID=UPI001F26BDCC|nr:RagB/SusD family nutrient uptake outer membrane protein [Dyadobacter sp. CY326]MCE7064627.1 RagB/SusD family nutrient uptake outer membrane protein [Dyadobacter sp. CY326]